MRYFGIMRELLGRSEQVVELEDRGCGGGEAPPKFSAFDALSLADERFVRTEEGLGFVAREDKSPIPLLLAVNDALVQDGGRCDPARVWVKDADALAVMPPFGGG
ncbi:MAG: hypothetical protein Kow0069_07820 [Promethearchaeota archaeon]